MIKLKKGGRDKTRIIILHPDRLKNLFFSKVSNLHFETLFLEVGKIQQ